MDLWLLVAGAIVLIAITVWIVWWPSRGDEDTVDNGDQPAPPAPAVQIRPPVDSPPLPLGEAARSAGEGGVRAYSEPSPQPSPRGRGRGRGGSLALMIALSVASAAGGAWLYARWQQRRGRRRR